MISTDADLMTFTDIRHLCTQDPGTGRWSGDTTSISAAANQDYRHVRDTANNLVWGAIWSELEMVFQDRGLNPDPDADDFIWQGLFDTYHRTLPVGGQVNTLLRASWNTALSLGPSDETRGRLVPDYPISLTQVDDRIQRNGLTIAKWNEVTQDLCVDPAYAPVLNVQYKNDQQAVFDLWLSLTGGRKFGACTPASVQQVIDNQNAIEDRNQAFLGTQDVRGKSQAANDAADAEYRDNPNATRQTVNDAGDNAYNA